MLDVGVMGPCDFMVKSLTILVHAPLHDSDALHIFTCIESAFDGSIPTLIFYE